MELAKRARQISPSPTLAIDAQAKKMQAEGMDVISFGVGEPDFDTPEHIKATAVEALNSGFTKYTAVAGIDALKEAIIRKFKEDNQLEYQPNQIVVSSGAKHSLYNCIQVLCDEGDEVILPTPYWVSYIEQIKLAGGIPKLVEAKESNGFKLTADELRQAINPKTKLLILNSPSNPTGAVYTRKELVALGKVIEEHNLWVISDEIYEKLVYDNLTHVSIASLSPKLKDLTVVINGVSKAYSMTGWRIGYTAAPPAVAKAMTDLQSHSTSNPTSFAQKASITALLGDQEPLNLMVKEFVKRRDYMLERLNSMSGVICNKPGGAFYLYPNISAFFGKSLGDREINNSTDFAEVLLAEARIAVVPGIAFGNEENIRLSYATSMEKIKEGMDRMELTLKILK
ncbi:MAG: pyridoxal phosphate-dependent aminotransferase [Clostridia bacterium]|nr:pyridoxal phosphate-dependent aminotransferase [Clostridia bacterium]